MLSGGKFFGLHRPFLLTVSMNFLFISTITIPKNFFVLSRISVGYNFLDIFNIFERFYDLYFWGSDSFINNLPIVKTIDPPIIKVVDPF